MKNFFTKCILAVLFLAITSGINAQSNLQGTVLYHNNPSKPIPSAELTLTDPSGIVVATAFTNGQGQFSMVNLQNFFTDPNTLGTLCYSLVLAFVATAVCLIIAYPVAYILSQSKLKRKAVILLLFVMPMWINFTLRITALKEILSMIEGNLAYYPFINTIIGMTYDFLPFMILPLYTTLSKLDKSVIEAASDLGADNFQTFIKVILPLSVPGIVSGVSMVFLPAMTNYVVLDMLYNSTYIMGSLIGSYFSAYDWHNGSMIALILLIIICIVSLISGDSDSEESGRGGALL